MIQIPQYDQHMLQTMELLTENITGEMDITEEKLIISSDGSHFQNKSDGAYIIAHENENILAKG